MTPRLTRWALFVLVFTVDYGLAERSSQATDAFISMVVHGSDESLHEALQLVRRGVVRGSAQDVVRNPTGKRETLKLVVIVFDHYCNVPRATYYRPLLLEMLTDGADPNAMSMVDEVSGTGKSVLYCAIGKGDIGLVRELIKRGARVGPQSVPVQEPHHAPALHWVADMSQIHSNYLPKTLLGFHSRVRAGLTIDDFAKEGLAHGGRGPGGALITNLSSAIYIEWSHNLASCQEGDLCRDIVESIDGSVETYERHQFQRIFAESALELFNLISQAPDFDVAHIRIPIHVRHDWDLPNTTGLHSLAGHRAYNAMGMTRALARMAIEQGPSEAAAMFDGLRAPDPIGRTPFHLAATRCGVEDGCVSALLAIAQDLSNAAGLPWESDAAFLNTLQPDIFNRSLREYLSIFDGSPGNLSGLITEDLSAKDEEIMAFKSISSQGREGSGDGDDVKACSGEEAYTEEQSGGWGVSPWGSTVYTATPPLRCDFEEVPPSKTQAPDFDIAPYIASRRPTMFRGAAQSLLMMENLKKERLLSLFGSRTVQAGSIPYASGFELSNASQDIPLSTFIDIVANFSLHRPEDSRAPAPYAFDEQFMHHDVEFVRQFLDTKLSILEKAQLGVSRHIWPDGPLKDGVQEVVSHR